MERETSTYERVMFFHARQKPVYFAFHLKMRGTIGEKDLRSGLAALRIRYPLSAVRLGHGPGNRQFITTENVPDYPVSVLERGLDWREVTSRELIKRIDESRGPMVKLLLIPGKNTTELLVFFHHAICDGISGLNFMKDLFRTLNGTPLSDSNLNDKTENNEWDPVLTEAVENDIKKEFQESELPVWLKHRLHLDMEIKPCPKHFPFLQPSFDIRSIELDESETDALQNRAKAWEVSVHSYLGAVMLSVFADRFARSTGYERIIQSPVSFRHFLKERHRDAFGIYMGIMKEKIDCSPERSPMQIASMINSGFRKQIDSTNNLRNYLSFMTYMLEEVDDPEAFFYSRPRHDFMDYDFSLSNLGKISFPDASGRLLQMHGPVFSAVDGERIFGVSTVNGRMTVTMIYDNNCFSAQWANDLFDRIRSKLYTF